MRTDGTGVAEGSLSLEKFLQLPDENEHRIELAKGRLVREPRPGAEHGWLVGNVFRELDSYVRERGLGLAIIETGFLLAVDPPTVRGPDVALISSANLPPGKIPIGFWTVAPDLAVEVVSPSNTVAEIQEKVLEYLAAGTQMVWVVDPRTRSVTTYGSLDEIRILTEADTVEGGEVIPGFRLEVADLFQPHHPPRH
jgi:Uma2 family endonuclease